jgi:hypothetical protein
MQKPPSHIAIQNQTQRKTKKLTQLREFKKILLKKTKTDSELPKIKSL